MKILVCVKQVPDLETRFKINEAGDWFDEADVAFRMNEYDEFAVEEAVALKGKSGADSDLTVLSIGPDRVKETIKKALAMGADRGVHIQDGEAHRKGPAQIAAMIAAFARDKEFELVFMGLQSQDRGSAQVGPLVALDLGFNLLTTVVGFEYDAGQVTVRRELEGGLKAQVKTKAPVVITCQLGLNKPRYPTLPNIMKAKKKELLTIPAEELGAGDALTNIVKAAPPERKGAGVALTGDVADVADKLISMIREKTGLV
ncbi:MAG: electron transfer flavoprotein subunit beta/FixA family protein [Nitrospinota bacterium]|nr:electron transfer flavoprotein subunit beta/FixA family protein [Nitrospinota bacterium]